MRKLLLILSLCSNAVLSAWATEIVYLRPVTSSFSAGIGQGKSRETYLTNLLYQGTALDLHYDRTRLMSQSRWDNLQLADLSYLRGYDTGAGSTKSLAVRLRYRYAMHKVWTMPSANVDLRVGPYFGMDLGATYNLRIANGNNPVTVRACSNFGLSARANWYYQLRGQRCSVDLTMQTPLIGAAGVPEFGESYYEISLDKKQNILQAMRFTSLHNQQDLDIRLTTDVPFAVIPRLRNGSSLRIGLAYHIDTMNVNDLISRYSTFQFVIGWSWKHLPYNPHRP